MHFALPELCILKILTSKKIRIVLVLKNKTKNKRVNQSAFSTPMSQVEPLYDQVYQILVINCTKQILC